MFFGRKAAVGITPMGQPSCSSQEKYVEGRHMEAFVQMQKLYADRFSNVRGLNGVLDVLDFGSGNEGVSRCISEPLLATHDRLWLYDPYTTITPPLNAKTSIVTDADVYGKHRKWYSIITLSYVLCSMEPDAAVDVVRLLRAEHPSAELLIVDYLLKGREHLVDALNADEELQWKSTLGTAEFIRTRTRYDMQELTKMLRKAHVPCTKNDIRPLDSKGIRGAVVVEPLEHGIVAY
jgi:hypothetical protein